ncbi:MAG TPA: hypothetical protein PKY56_03030 [Candidatus Kapabacteria bacterium]|nr:hypothetical protein [Candidatus Kapabacteria bacterium]HPO61666.1 hypothetical protein [Candidatus Kapabacteria bacterium]
MSNFTPKKLSTINTKQQMLDAYNELLQEIEEKKKQELKPEEIIKEKEVKKVIVEADNLVDTGIDGLLSQLKNEFNKTITNLEQQLHSSQAKYDNLKKAIDAKQAELKEIYDIDKSANSLAALIETYNRKKIEFENEIESEKEEFESEMAAKKEAWDIEKKTNQTELKEKEAEEQKRRQREKEEFIYNFEKEKRNSLDKLNEEKTALIKEIAEMKEKAEKELTLREQSIVTNETELKELRAKAASFNKELENAVNKAVKEATEKIILDSKHREEILLKEIEGERKLYKAQIEALQKSISEQNDQIQKLSVQLEKSYSQVQDIAIRAVESSPRKQLQYSNTNASE